MLRKPEPGDAEERSVLSFDYNPSWFISIFGFFICFRSAVSCCVIIKLSVLELEGSIVPCFIRLAKFYLFFAREFQLTDILEEIYEWTVWVSEVQKLFSDSSSELEVRSSLL